MKEHIDWAQLETDYITGNCSYNSLGKKYGISQSRVGAAAHKGKWIQKRRDYREKVRELAVEKCANEEAAAIAALTDTADRVAEVFARIAADEKQFCRYIVQEKNGTQSVSEERIFEKRDVKSLREMTAALKDMVFVIRDLHGAPNVQDRAAMECSRRKLELEEEKARGGFQEESTACGVILIPKED